MNHVLFISNDPLLRLENVDIPIKSGLHITYVSGIMEALIVLNRISFDAIIIDEQLADMGSYQAYKKIRQHWNIPIILVGSGPAEKVWIDTPNLGFDRFLKKPIEPIDLLRHAKAVIERTQASMPFSEINHLSEKSEHHLKKAGAVSWQRSVECPNCGTENLSTYRFCGKCGNKLNGAIQPVATIPQSENKSINLEEIVKSEPLNNDDAGTCLSDEEISHTCSVLQETIPEAKALVDVVSYLERQLTRMKAVTDRISQVQETIKEANTVIRRQEQDFDKMVELLGKAKNQLDDI